MAMSAQHLLDLLKSDDEFAPSLFSLGAVYLVVTVPILATLLAVFLIVVPTGSAGVPSPTGCRLVGLQDRSNLDDQLEPKHGEGTLDEKTWRVKALFLYPIKSCRGVEVEQSEVVATGLQYDRQFTFARFRTAQNEGAKSDQPWKFVTQREFPLLSQVKAQLWVPDSKRPAYRKDLPYVETNGAIVVTFPWAEKGIKARLGRLSASLTGYQSTKSFIIPFNPTSEHLKRDYTQERVTIWGETITATNMGLHVPAEFKQYIGCSQPLTLFRINHEREIFRSAPRKEQLGWQPITGFADAFPLHLAGLASVHKVSKDQPAGSPILTAQRFRANVYITGTPPFEEDEWLRVQIGNKAYYVNCRCVRCTIPNIEPTTGERSLTQPRKTLREKRNVDRGAPGEGCLGVNMVPAEQTGSIKVGDSMQVLERGELVYIW